MHSCTYVISLFFLEKKEWNLNCFHFFREMKSEIIFLFTLFEKWKVNWFLISLFSRSESEIEKPRDRDREVKYEKNSREFSRNETLAGYCNTYNWEPWLMTIFVTRQLIVTLDSIRNSCDVFIIMPSIALPTSSSSSCQWFFCNSVKFNWES